MRFRTGGRTRLLPLLVLMLACGREGAQNLAPAPAAKGAAARKVAAAPAPLPPPCPERPNILLVSLDTVRYDATSLDPKSSNDTPFLRSLAAAGTSFSRCYSTHDATPKSHFSMLTGFVNGLRTEIDVPEVSLAYQLAKRGYRTFGVAANGNLDPEFARYLMPFGRYVNLWDVWKELPADRKAGLTEKIDAKLRAYDHAANDLNRMLVFSSAAMVLRHVEPRLEGKQPFFGFLNILDAHDPYLPDTGAYDRGRERASVPDLRHRELPAYLADAKAIEDERRRKRIMTALQTAHPWKTAFDLNAAQRATYRRRYHAKVAEVDDAVRDLFAMLRKRGLLDATIVIITSDHGEAFGEADLMTHSFQNEGDREATNHVPLLIVFPPCYRFGSRSVRELVTIADIVPTMYELLDIDPHAVWRKSVPGNFGRSLMPLIRGNSAPGTTAAAGAADRAISAQERQRQDDEAMARFRALGYLQ